MFKNFSGGAPPNSQSIKSMVIFFLPKSSSEHFFLRYCAETAKKLKHTNVGGAI